MDKREAVRVPAHIHARCRLDTGVVVDGMVADVSRSGMFVVADHPLACGSQTSIVIDLPDEPAVQIEAEVVRADDSGFGLRFVDTSTSHRPLANFIMKRAHDTRS